MNIYTIYVNPKDDSYPIAIKEGFSLPAAIFNSFWALYHGMWKILFVILLINTIIINFQTNNNMLVFILHLAIMLIFGFFASDLREYSLNSKGYLLEDIILASSEEEAKLKFLTKVK